MSRKQFERFVLQKYLGGNVRKYKQTYNLVAYLVQRNLDSNNYVNRSYSFFNNCLPPTLHKDVGFVVRLNGVDDMFVILTIKKGEDVLFNELKKLEVKYTLLDNINDLDSKIITQIWGTGEVEL